MFIILKRSLGLHTINILERKTKTVMFPKSLRMPQALRLVPSTNSIMIALSMILTSETTEALSVSKKDCLGKRNEIQQCGFILGTTPSKDASLVYWITSPDFETCFDKCPETSMSQKMKKRKGNAAEVTIKHTWRWWKIITRIVRANEGYEENGITTQSDGSV